MILSEVEELRESVRKMEKRLAREHADIQLRQIIKDRLTAARQRIAEIERADEELHQRALQQHREQQQQRS